MHDPLTRVSGAWELRPQNEAPRDYGFTILMNFNFTILGWISIYENNDYYRFFTFIDHNTFNKPFTVAETVP